MKALNSSSNTFSSSKILNNIQIPREIPKQQTADIRSLRSPSNLYALVPFYSTVFSGSQQVYNSNYTICPTINYPFTFKLLFLNLHKLMKLQNNGAQNKRRVTEHHPHLLPQTKEFPSICCCFCLASRMNLDLGM